MANKSKDRGRENLKKGNDQNRGKQQQVSNKPDENIQRGNLENERSNQQANQTGKKGSFGGNR